MINDKNNKHHLRKEYQKRLNSVIDYIDKNLFNELNLEKISQTANFSQYHFSRLFKSLMGETIFQYIQRLRLERAADKLLQNQDVSISEVAYDIGYSDPASFTKAFNNYFGMTPTDWKLMKLSGKSKYEQMKSNINHVKSKNTNEFENSQFYISNVFYDNFNNIFWRIEMNSTNKLEVNVEVKEMNPITVAYIRHIGPYAGNQKLFGNLFGKLFQWAGSRCLIRFPETKMMTIYHDNPDITEEEKLRISVCISVPNDTKVEGEVGKMEIPGGKYAIAHFEIDSSQYGEAWNLIYGGWLPESGYQPDDRPCYELYLNDPNQHPEKKHIVDIYVPVKPL